jgi:hypothetical protein
MDTDGISGGRAGTAFFYYESNEWHEWDFRRGRIHPARDRGNSRRLNLEIRKMEGEGGPRSEVRGPETGDSSIQFSQQPTINNQQPTINNQQPTTNNQQPTINDQQPTINNQRPTISITYQPELTFRVESQRAMAAKTSG